jgi:hypothetical protein
MFGTLRNTTLWIKVGKETEYLCSLKICRMLRSYKDKNENFNEKTFLISP